VGACRGWEDGKEATSVSNPQAEKQEFADSIFGYLDGDAEMLGSGACQGTFIFEGQVYTCGRVSDW
jgi:hypothetical protein